jgi:hypothetical protein
LDGKAGAKAALGRKSCGTFHFWHLVARIWGLFFILLHKIKIFGIPFGILEIFFGRTYKEKFIFL